MLAPNGSIDMPKMQQLADKAHSLKLGITFHRAIDQSSDYQAALEQVISLGCERILTSGLAVNAEQGVHVLADMVKQAVGRIDIMAGAGVNTTNAKMIQSTTQVPALHLSGKSTRPSLMENNSSAQMGNSDIDDYQIPITDVSKISSCESRSRRLG